MLNPKPYFGISTWGGAAPTELSGAGATGKNSRRVLVGALSIS